MYGISGKNASGYPDPTAHDALANVYREEVETELQVERLLHAFRVMAFAAGFEVAGPVVIRDPRTGRRYE